MSSRLRKPLPMRHSKHDFKPEPLPITTPASVPVITLPITRPPPPLPTQLLRPREGIKKPSDAHLTPPINTYYSRMSSKFFPTVYTPPTCKDTAVIMVFFNPAGSVRIVQNLLMVKYMLESAKIPLFIGEVAVDTIPFVLAEAPNVYHIRTKSHMFYKENVAAYVEKKVPAEFTKIVLMDADIVYTTPGWLDIISEDLEKYTILQGFANAHWLDLYFNKIKSNQTVILRSDGHPGFVWAFQRKWLKDVGVFQYALIGSGDTCLVSQINKSMMVKNIYLPMYLEWPKTGDITKGYSERLEVYHLPHGNIEHRNYLNRFGILEAIVNKHKLKKLTDMVDVRDDGIFEWKDTYRDECNKAITDYFKGRKDDGY
jgi:hypothetical protein